MADTFECTVCGESHPWPTLHHAVFLPKAYLEIPERQRQFRGRLDSERGHVVIDNRHAFLRSELQIPVRDSDRAVIFKTWMQVAMPQARFLADRWRQVHNKEPVPPFPAVMNDELPGYKKTQGLRALLEAQSSEIPPRVQILESRNQLYLDQRDGLDAEGLRRVASALVHAG